MEMTQVTNIGVGMQTQETAVEHCSEFDPGLGFSQPSLLQPLLGGIVTMPLNFACGDCSVQPPSVP